MTPQTKQPTYLTGFQVAFLVVCAVVLLGSIAWRAFANASGAGGAASAPAGSAGMVPGSASAGGEGSTALVPYFTAAGIFGILGFAAGFVMRKIVLGVLLVVGFLVIVVFALAATHVIVIPWPEITDWLNRTLLDMKGKIPPAESLLHHVPSAGTASMGFGLGLQRKSAP
jgi:uncharacterized membrane protein (Fun14 family)